MPRPRPKRPSTRPRRRELALALVAERGFVRVAELSEAFGVTTVTARADLDALERQGSIRRVHGGAVPVSSVLEAERPEREPSFEEALAASVEPKRLHRRARRIARAQRPEHHPRRRHHDAAGGTRPARPQRPRRPRRLHERPLDRARARGGDPAVHGRSSRAARCARSSTRSCTRSPAPCSSDVHVDLAFIGCNGVDPAARRDELEPARGGREVAHAQGGGTLVRRRRRLEARRGPPRHASRRSTRSTCSSRMPRRRRRSSPNSRQSGLAVHLARDPKVDP